MHSLLNLQGSRLFRLILPQTAPCGPPARRCRFPSCLRRNLPTACYPPSNVAPPPCGRANQDKPRRMGDRLLLLDHGIEALALRVNLIRSARKSIRIQTFNWKTDETGRFLFRELLRATKQRGVEVEILIDHMFCEQERETVAFLSSVDPRFRLKFYNPCFNQLAPDVLTQVAQGSLRLPPTQRPAPQQTIHRGRPPRRHERKQPLQPVLRPLPRSTTRTAASCHPPQPYPTNQCFLEYWNSPHAADAVALEERGQTPPGSKLSVLRTKMTSAQPPFQRTRRTASDSAHLAENFSPASSP